MWLWPLIFMRLQFSVYTHAVWSKIVNVRSSVMLEYCDAFTSLAPFASLKPVIYSTTEWCCVATSTSHDGSDHYADLSNISVHGTARSGRLGCSNRRQAVPARAWWLRRPPALRRHQCQIERTWSLIYICYLPIPFTFSWIIHQNAEMNERKDNAGVNANIKHS